MKDVYALSDAIISSKVGVHLKSLRLKQNTTQQGLAEAANVSLSTVKKLEKGEIGSFDAFILVLRILGKLDVLQPLVEEPQMSPSEYYALTQKAGAHQRKRAATARKDKEKEESAW